MFLNKNYISSNELVEKMGIHIANISMLRNSLEYDDDITTIVKKGGASFIKKNSYKLPSNIKEGIVNNEFTDISNKLPCPFVKSEYQVSEKELMKSGLVISKEKIAGKDFYVFSDDFVKKVRNKIVYTLNKEETMECFAKKQIDGYIQVSKNKFLTWY